MYPTINRNNPIIIRGNPTNLAKTFVPEFISQENKDIINPSIIKLNPV